VVVRTVAGRQRGGTRVAHRFDHHLFLFAILLMSFHAPASSIRYAREQSLEGPDSE
jgi:hypothetical protein